jgi:hypothetical protein
MELIERYLHAVGRNLPGKQREDIQAEIRSLIEDMLEDHSQAAGKEPNEEMVEAVLIELGSPEDMAAKFKPTQYLIGPKAYPLFILVTKIVLSVLFGLMLFGMVTSFVVGDGNGSSIIQVLAGGWSTLIQAFAWIVIVFAILEKTLPDFKADLSEKDEAFDPKDLPEIEEFKPFRPAEKIFEVFWLILGLVVLNIYPHWIGGFSSIKGSDAFFVPLLSSAFADTYLLLFNIRWALGLALNFTLLLQRGWKPYTRWASFGLTFFDIALLFKLIKGPSVIGLNPEYLARHGLTMESIPNFYTDTLIPLAKTGCKMAFVIALIVTSVTLTIDLVKYARRQAITIELPLKKEN